MNCDVAIIGGGAAGLMCAIEAGKRGLSVLVLDHNERIGQKLLASGGGRCNFTNLNSSAERYVSENGHFAKSALARFSPHDFVAMLEKHRIPWREEENGQLFCARSSRDVVEMLEKECRGASVRIATGCRVRTVEKKGRFVIGCSHGTFEAGRLVIATGGLSYPSLGASGFGHRIAKKFGIAVTELKPGLVPLIFGTDDRARYAGLAGISFEASVSCRGKSYRGGALFTHRGLSGPAILQISSHWRKGERIAIDLFPGEDALKFLSAENRAGGKAGLKTIIARRLTQRLANAWCRATAPSRPISSCSEAELKNIAKLLHGWKVLPSGTEGYAKAEVTVGGVDTHGMSSKTMESSKVPGLYFIGEVLDVTGELGGFNLQWAWASGSAAGRAV
ncbi:MAG: NAD(P)/FAD-dependent oxidoreductase [Pseudomonadota bacterium]